MTVVEQERLPELRLRLPGRWWQIPLHDRDEARAAVRELARLRLGPGDERAPARIEVERRLLAALDEAIRGDGQAFHIALSIVPGVPIPITAAVALPAQRLSPAIGTSAAATMGVLARGVAAATEGGEEGLHRFTAGESEVVRRHRRREETVSEGDETVVVDTLLAEYWMTVPGTKRFVLVAFSAPLGSLEPVLLELFDSIVSASYWAR